MASLVKTWCTVSVNLQGATDAGTVEDEGVDMRLVIQGDCWLLASESPRLRWSVVLHQEFQALCLFASVVWVW